MSGEGGSRHGRQVTRLPPPQARPCLSLPPQGPGIDHDGRLRAGGLQQPLTSWGPSQGLPPLCHGIWAPETSPALLTPIRANDELGHSKCKGAACRDGDHILPAQVALALTLRDG